VGWAKTTSNAAQHAFLYNGSTMTDIGTLGGTDSEAYDINDSGQVVGWSYTTGNATFHAFLNDGSTMTDLGTLGRTRSQAFGINASGQVVGTVFNSGYNDQHAFLYSDSTMIDLNALVDQLSGWTKVYARDINDSGQIVGYGLIGGETHSFLLTPIPEPSALALFGIGVLGLLTSTWRRRKRGA
jgi:probable HAF family extracellular repeat protein